MKPASMPRRATLAAALAVALPLAGQAATHPDFSVPNPQPLYIAASCPPGLAKKSPACIPPGQVRPQARPSWNIGHEHLIGHRVSEGYTIVESPSRYGLDPAQLYYRIGNNVYLVDRETREVLDFIGAAAALLN